MVFKTDTFLSSSPPLLFLPPVLPPSPSPLLSRSKWEFDDLEADEDTIFCKEVDVTTAMWHMEWERGEERFKKQKDQDVREQRSRWKVKDIRRKVAARENPNPKLRVCGEPTDDVLGDQFKDQGFAGRAGHPVPLDMIQSVSYLKRREWQGKEQYHLRREDEMDAEDHHEEAVQGGYGNARMRELFDEVAEGTRVVLKDFTYDLRRDKTDMRGNSEIYCKECGIVRIKCICESDSDG